MLTLLLAAQLIGPSPAIHSFVVRDTTYETELSIATFDVPNPHKIIIDVCQGGRCETVMPRFEIPQTAAPVREFHDLRLPEIRCEDAVCYDSFTGEPWTPPQVQVTPAHHVDPWYMQAGFIACGAGVVADIATSLYNHGKHQGVIIEGNGLYAPLEQKPIPFALARLATGAAQCAAPYLLHRFDFKGVKVASGIFLATSTVLVWKQAFDNEDLRRQVERRRE